MESVTGRRERVTSIMDRMDGDTARARELLGPDSG
jgi:hypothetical protein